MNLAQVVDYNPDTRRYRINPEKARLPVRAAAAAAAPIVVREHHAKPKDERPVVSGVRRALRDAGEEVMRVLRASREHLTFMQLSRALPHVPQTTLHVRLSNMVARGDIVREGESRDYRYTATEACS